MLKYALYHTALCAIMYYIHSITREDFSPPVSPAAERLRHILGEEDGPPTPTLFTEMDTLQQEGGELEWKESARCKHTRFIGGGGRQGFNLKLQVESRLNRLLPAGG